MSSPIIVWFRRDLRIADNPALFHAAKTGRPIIALYIWEMDKERSPGGASKWWLHHSLLSISKDLQAIGLRLVLRAGPAVDVLHDLVNETSADRVVWNRRYAGDDIARDSQIKSRFSENGIETESYNGNLLNEPWDIKNGSGGYYKVFTPYWRSVLSRGEPGPPLPCPAVATPSKQVKSLEFSDLNLSPKGPDWGQKMHPYWTPGSKGATNALAEFLEGPVTHYAHDRDVPSQAGTSRLSPHLAFGEISPRQIWHACRSKDALTEKYLSEIGWREFSYSLLFNNPDLARTNFKPEFDNFEWKTPPSGLKQWQSGQTGYPLVDAGMRQLWATGWQHNRVRMVTASFLIKHLMIDWREGESWFWDTLVDADPASNPASWQWVAGSGADASPYFRIFNPVAQGEKFDPNGDYIRKWVPEITALPNRYIHKPWQAPKDVLHAANIELGASYPHPIVEHKFARTRALDAYKKMRTLKET